MVYFYVAELRLRQANIQGAVFFYNIGCFDTCKVYAAYGLATDNEHGFGIGQEAPRLLVLQYIFELVFDQFELADVFDLLQYNVVYNDGLLLVEIAPDLGSVHHPYNGQ